MLFSLSIGVVCSRTRVLDFRVIPLQSRPAVRKKKFLSRFVFLILAVQTFVYFCYGSSDHVHFRPF